MGNRTRYTLVDKPKFKYGDIVTVSAMEMIPGIESYNIPFYPKGKIVGIATRGIIDQWMVEFDFDWPSYPYKVVIIPHVFIINEK